jgi:EmrB/QacA subfamily drug resistance transporter
LRKLQLSNERIVGIVFVAAMFMSIMDSTIMNVALPTLAHQFRSTTASAQWVIVGYLLSTAAVVAASGWFGDRFGTKRMMLGAISVFVASSILCALSRNLGQLIAFRIVQGLGGGMVMPLGMTMLIRTYPPERRAQVSRILMFPTVLAPATGPIIGGAIITGLSWRWIFLVNVPIGVGLLVVGARRLPEHRQSADSRFDLQGLFLSAAGLALLLYALSEGPIVGWATPSVLISAVLAVASLGYFVRVELQQSDPLLDLRLLGDRLFRRMNVVNSFAGAAFLGALFLFSLFVQEGRGYGPLASGLTTFPEAVGVIVSMQTVGRLYARVGPRRLMMFGLGLMCACLVTFAFAGSGTNLWVIRLLIFAVGFGMGAVILSVQAAAYATISPAEAGHASAIFSTQFQASAATGIAVLGTILSAVGGRGVVPKPSTFRIDFLVAAASAFIACVYSLRINDHDARVTMTRAHSTAPDGALTPVE